MKKIVLVLGLLLFTLLGNAQATHTDQLRVVNATTALGKNIPVGTTVYDMNTGDYFISNTGVISTATLTTASGSFDQINGGGAANLSEGTTTNTTVDVNSSTGTNATLLAASTSRAGVMTKAKFDEVVLNNAKATNVSTNLSLGTITATTMDVNSSDGTNATLVEADTNDAGLLGAAKWDEIVANTAKVVYTMITETFEEDDGTPTAHSLGQTALTGQGARVALNGSTIKPANYTLATGTITITGITVSQYDEVTITYSY